MKAQELISQAIAQAKYRLTPSNCVMAFRSHSSSRATRSRRPNGRKSFKFAWLVTVFLLPLNSEETLDRCFRHCRRNRPAIRSDDPNFAAQDYIQRAYNGQTRSITPGEDGGFIATLPDGAIITFRPAGQASEKTESSTASVDINDSKINQLNGGRPLKLKFPKK